MVSFRWGAFAQLSEAVLLNDANVEIDRHDDIEFATKHFGGDEGQGTLEYLHTPDVRVIVSDFVVSSDRSYEIADEGLVRFHFGSELSIQTWRERDWFRDIADNPAGLLISHPDQVMRECIEAGQNQSFVTIACKPEWLEARFGVRLPDSFGYRAVSEAAGVFHHPINYGRDLRQAAVEMFGRRPPGRLRSAFVSAKATEMLVLALGGLSKGNSNNHQLTELDAAAVRQARSIIEQSLTTVPDIHQLSRIVGINRTKLFYGFKQLYGMSVTHFAHRHRMDHACRLLANTTMTVSEIASAVGYEHSCNFSTRFRAHFDCSPRDYRTRHCRMFGS